MISEKQTPGDLKLTIREIAGAGEMRSVEMLQKDVWGFSDSDVVPLTQLVAAAKAGGVVLGAFDGNRLAGFAYGFAGYEEGKVTHHSHMLAVSVAYRNAGIGYKLKLAQREFALARGIDQMTWTFDPLQSLNAYFNFSRLGVVADRYLVDFYGTQPASFLHKNGTDRLWVTWRLSSPEVEERLLDAKPIYPLKRARCILKVSKEGGPQFDDLALAGDSEIVLLEIPVDIPELEEHDNDLACDWRLATRRAFLDAFSAGLMAVDYIMVAGEVNDKTVGKYVLAKKKGPTEDSKK